MTDEAAPTNWTGYLLNTVGARVREATAEALIPWGITPRDLGALTALADSPGLSQIALGRQIGMDRTSILQLADRLEAAGWVERHAHPADRRVNLLVLSRAGHQRLGEAVPAARAAEARCLASLTSAERDTLQSLLRHALGEDSAG